MRKLLFASLGAALLVVAVGSGAFAQSRPPFPGSKIDLREGEAPPDLGDIVDAQPGANKRIGFNIMVNDPQEPFPEGLLGRSETTLALSANGKNVTAGWNDAQGFCGPPFGSACDKGNQNGLSGFGFSKSGGLNWVDIGAPPVIDNIYTRGDPWMDRGGFNGNTYYYANLAVDSVDAHDLGISVHRGKFKGKNFVFQGVTVFNAPNAPNDFYDKEALVAGKGANAGDVYVSLTNFIELCGEPQFGFGQIEVWSSANGGVSFQGPYIAAPEAEDSRDSCGNEGHLQQSSAPAIDPDGTVYVVWQYGPDFQADGSFTLDDTEIRFAKSSDGGVTWSDPSTVAVINTSRGNPPVAYNRGRINDHPRIEVEQYSGRIYVTYYSTVTPTPPGGVIPCPPEAPPGSICIEQTLTSSQVYVKYSDDGGETWSDAVEVAPTPPATGVKRWWPDVTVDSNGTVHVVYYQSREKQATPDPDDTECIVNIGTPLRRTGPNSSLVDTYWVFSQDGGNSFSMPLKLSTATSNWCKVVSNIRPNMGDYIDAQAFVPGGSGAGATASWVAAVWADGRNGVPDTFYTHAQGPTP